MPQSPLAAPGHPVFDSWRPLVFAHRGGAALRPENTMVAFDHGVALGADGLELDVHLARDGELVVIHDATLDRTTDARGPVARLTSSELERVDAGSRFRDEGGRHPYRGAGHGVPRLRDVLARHPCVPIIVELKGRDTRLPAAAVALVREQKSLGRVCFGGASDHVVRAARASGRDVVTSAAKEEVRWALYRSWVGLDPSGPGYQGFQVPESAGLIRVVSPAFVRRMRRLGLPVQVWTVNRDADMRRLLGWGVQALITDRPDVAVPIVSALRGAAR
jgi:glycerophosphoryl diester phosphodiesterase